MPRGLPTFNDHPAGFGDCQQAGVYRGLCVHLVDGDTYDVLVDLGFYQYSLIPIRLRGADTPERNARDPEERVRATAATARASELLHDRPVLMRTYRDRRSFARYVGDVFVQAPAPAPDAPPDPHALGVIDLDGEAWVAVRDLLVAEGHAVGS